MIKRSSAGFSPNWRPVAAFLVTLVVAAEAVAQPVPLHERATLTPAMSGVATASNRFAFDLFAELRKDRADNDNIMISPLSVSTALAMTYAGARGNTAAQMAEVLHLDAAPAGQEHGGFGQLIADLNSDRAGYELNVANRLFGQQDFPFRPEFLQQLADGYQAPLEQLNFVAAPDPSRVHINEWVADQTNDRIRDLLPAGSVTADTRLVLTNAVYFNGKWKHQFDPETTSPAPFYLTDATATSTPTMRHTRGYGFGQFDGYKMLEMLYEGDDLSMVVMLPDQRDGLFALEASLTSELFQSSVASLVTQRVDVQLPKFTFKDRAGLGGPLASLGMPEAFSDSADFTGMSDGGGLSISDVLHQTFIALNEAGTEAAGATAVVIETTSIPPPAPAFIADHPFLFALRDRHTGALLFLGRMADPVAATASALAEVPEPTAVALGLVGIAALGACRKKHPRAH